ncbi:MAG: DUF4132 domain-containing protein [Tannerellaceae bacterium]|jgi:hypothetical protein|nr:DUF4132 domain-containing protein [Tannerellaceae bacterium]
MQLFVNVSRPITPREADPGFNVRRVFQLLQTPLLSKLIGNTQPAAYLIFEKMNGLAGSRAGIGGNGGSRVMEGRDELRPLSDCWREFYCNEIKDFPSALQLLFALSTNWGEGQNYKVYEFMNREFLPDIRKFYGFDLHPLKKAMAGLPHMAVVGDILTVMGEEYWDASYAGRMAENILASFLPMLDRANARREFIDETYVRNSRRTVFIHQHSAISYWLSEQFGRRQPEDAFRAYFSLRYPFYHKSDCLTTRPPAAITRSPLTVFDFGHACDMGLIDETELRAELESRANAGESLQLSSAFCYGQLNPRSRNRLEAYGEAAFSLLREITLKVTDNIVHTELHNIDGGVTGVSHLAMKLDRIEGVHTFIDILRASVGEGLCRIGHIYGSSYTRREVLTRLLSICHPAPGDTPVSLALSAKEASISMQCLIEASFHAPQWLPMIEVCTGWRGLEGMVCFFHAHLNDRCSEEMKARIARFTSLPQEDLCMGVLDINWLRRARRETGQNRFLKIYAAACIVSPGMEYTRLSKCMEALSGRMDTEGVRREVEDKRNRDMLIAYGIIPLTGRLGGDLVERYSYMLRFFEESKVYGSQRHESERRAVELAMMNLALNAGYNCRSRLIWSMETLTLKSVMPHLSPIHKNGVNIYLKADDTGRPGVHFFKFGKELLSAPAKLRKDTHVAHLRSLSKHLRVIYARSGHMLEQSMEECTLFRISDLKAFRRNPFIWPLLRHAVFINEGSGALGFFDAGGLTAPGMEAVPQGGREALRLAHPVDIEAAGMGSLFMDYALDNNIWQPFEQILRKSYRVSDQDKLSTYSLYKAGHPMLTATAPGILKERRWIATGDETWQKSYPAHNTTAAIEVISRKEGNTDIYTCYLQRISFSDSRTGRPLVTGSVPPHIYSEIIRDADMLFA